MTNGGRNIAGMALRRPTHGRPSWSIERSDEGNRVSDFIRAQLATDDVWAERGACRGSATPDAWFPPKGGKHDQETRLAKRICATQCPVAAECLEAAMTWDGPVYGIWGGTTEKERRAFHRQRERDTAS